MARTALVIVDLQRDFLPGGARGVPDGDAVIAPRGVAAAHADVIVASRDMHPEDHCSFTQQGGVWPVHCVAGSRGADLDATIAALPLARTVDKATTRERDAYSAFDGTDLAAWLRREQVTRLLVAGLATDYCVRATALDAIRAGFDVVVVRDACRGVNATAGDADRALVEMQAAGALIASSTSLDD
jgi:nicotinamidase/pyrazinamidase